MNVSGSWLTPVTRNTIKTAFGDVMGTTVINATIAYFNDLPPIQAQKLSLLVNEDPMMVCSLGLNVENMPIRTMYTDGTTYSITELIPNSTTKVNTAVRRYATGAYKYIFGSCGTAAKQSYYFLGTNGDQWYNEVRGSNNNFGTATVQVHYTLEFTTLYTKVDGVQYDHGGSGVLGANTTQMTIGRAATAAGGIYDNPWIGTIDYIIVETNGTIVGNFLPFYDKRREMMVWVDTRTGNYAQNVGTWVEKYELPDGTPWTPANQTT